MNMVQQLIEDMTEVCPKCGPSVEAGARATCSDCMQGQGRVLTKDGVELARWFTRHTRDWLTPDSRGGWEL